jgi:peptide/nickel transport system permease protein
VLFIVLLLWPRYARQIRGETLALRERDFVRSPASRTAAISGSSAAHPAERRPDLLVIATLQSGYVVLLESTLSFLGAGIPPSTPRGD